MRKDYRFKAPELSDEETKAWATCSEGLSADEVLAQGDDPPIVLATARRHVEAREAWAAGAKDRPLTHDHVTLHTRLFDGPWIAERHIGSRMVEATYDIGPSDRMPEERVFARCVEPVWDTYEKLMKADDEEGCRKLAGAIYESQGMRDAADRMLCTAAREAREALPPEVDETEPRKAP